MNVNNLNPRMRPPPSRDVDGSFSPYPVQDLKMARNILINELYFSPGGGRTVHRVREVTGILPNRHGIYIGNQMFPDVSNYSDQSTSLISMSVPSNNLALENNHASSPKTSDFKGFQGDVQTDTHRFLKKTRKISKSVEGMDKSEANNTLSHDVVEYETNQNIPITVKAYKCDFCNYISKNQIAVKDHLINKLHYSASTYDCLLTKDKLKPCSVCREMSLVNEAASFSSVIAVCSYCLSIFKNIHSCARHSTKVHGKGIYSLADVRKTQKITVTKYDNCAVCKSCSTPKQMVTHLKQHDMQYHSYEHPHSTDIVLCICPKCRFTTCSITRCRIHILSHLICLENKTMEFRLLFIEKPSSEYQLLLSKNYKKSKVRKRRKKAKQPPHQKKLKTVKH